MSTPKPHAASTQKPHATTTCPTCSGSGRVPHAPGHYRIEIQYQDGREHLDFPADQYQKAWAKARRIADGDPSCNATLIRPDGSIAGVVPSDRNKGGAP